MSILIIEDDIKVLDFLRESLETEFSPVESFTEFPGEEEVTFVSPEPQAIILDRLVGNYDTKFGISFLRKKFPRSPILVLSAISNPSERSELLDLGVDDYMGKPFSVVELKARIRALSRRMQKPEQTQYLKVDTTVLDLIHRTVSVGERRTGLSAKEFDLFSVLMRSPGRVYSKFELLDKVWQANLEIESNVVEVTVMALRKKLLEIKSTLMISSKRNLGYWIEA